MKALVTGGAGFMGSHVVDALLARNCDVVALDDLSGGFEDNVNPKAVFVRGSVLDRPLITKIFEQYRFDYVFHLAAYAAEGLSHFIRHFNYENNLIGSINLINASVVHGVKCFVFTSSIAVYGSNQLPMTESLDPKPEDPYGISKYAVELDLRAAYEMFGLNSVVFRPHNVYGERQNTGDKYRNVIGIFMNQILSGQPMPVFGDGSQTRAFSYIGDVAPVIADSAFRPECYNEVFNVGSDHPYPVKTVAEKVAAAFGVEPVIRYLPARLEVQHAYATHDKIRQKLGFQSNTSLEEGIHRMAEWARRIGPRRSAVFSQIEIERNLPSSWRTGT